MKKILFNTLPMAMVMLASLTACSSDDVQGDVNNSGKGVLEIKLTESNSDENDATRCIMKDSYVVDSQQVKLNNGCVANVVVTKDPDKEIMNLTRATETYSTAKAGDYTVIAYKDGSIAYTFTGHWDGSTFTKNGTWEIDPGTYKILCYQQSGFDDVSINDLYVSSRNQHIQNNERALVSEAQTIDIKSGKNDISFNLKRKSSGVRLIFNSTSTLANLDLEMKYNAKSYKYTMPDLSVSSSSLGETTIPLSMDAENANTTQYVYLTEGLNSTDMTVRFNGGTITKDGVTNKLDGITFNLKNFTTTLGKRYTVKMTINFSSLTYFIPVILQENLWIDDEVANGGSYEVNN